LRRAFSEIDKAGVSGRRLERHIARPSHSERFLLGRYLGA
jgi:hypothetical protein